MIYFFLGFISAVGLVLVYWKKHLELQQKGSWAKEMLQRLHVKRIAEKQEEKEQQVEMLLLTPEQQKTLKDTFMSAEAYFENGDLDEAERLYVQVLSLDDEHLETNMRLGLIYLKKQLAKKAEAIFRKVLAISPKDPLALSNLGMALYMQHNFEDAKEVYREAIALDPNRAARYISLAHVYRELGDFPSAVEAIQKAFRLDPQHNDYRLLLAETYCDMEDLVPARTIVQNILKHEGAKSPLRKTARVLLKRIDNKSGVADTSGNTSLI